MSIIPAIDVVIAWSVDRASSDDDHHIRASNDIGRGGGSQARAWAIL
jgi:hypothetical protein